MTDVLYRRRVRRAAARLGCRITKDGQLVHVNTSRVMLGPTTFDAIEELIDAMSQGPQPAVGQYVLDVQPEGRDAGALWDAVVASGDGYRPGRCLSVVEDSEKAARDRLAAIQRTFTGPFFWVIKLVETAAEERGEFTTQMLRVVNCGWSGRPTQTSIVVCGRDG